MLQKTKYCKRESERERERESERESTKYGMSERASRIELNILNSAIKLYEVTTLLQQCASTCGSCWNFY